MEALGAQQGLCWGQQGPETGSALEEVHWGYMQAAMALQSVGTGAGRAVTGARGGGAWEALGAISGAEAEPLAGVAGPG